MKTLFVSANPLSNFQRKLLAEITTGKIDRFESRSLLQEIYRALRSSIEERAYPHKKPGKNARAIVCECGAKILIIPDLDGMAKCIEAHAAKHEKNQTEPEKAEAEYSRIEEQLTQKVLMSIGENI